jgi:hypothetical protein
MYRTNKIVSFRKISILGFTIFTLSLLLLQAADLRKIEITDESYSEFQQWQEDFSPSTSSEEIETLREKPVSLSPILPGMSPQTQLLAVTFRDLLVSHLLKEKYKLSVYRDSEMESRWILAEDRLIRIPAEAKRIVLSARFFKAMSGLGKNEMQRLCDEEKIENLALSDMQAFDFFFMADSLRRTRLEAGGESGKTLADHFYEDVVLSKSLEYKFRKMDEKEKKEFAKWMVEEVFSKLINQTDGRKKILAIVKAGQQKKPVGLSKTLTKIDSKFNTSSLRTFDVVAMFAYLLENS